MSEYKGKDPVIKRIHTNLNKIAWILEHKQPWTEKAEQAQQTEDLMKIFGKGFDFK